MPKKKIWASIQRIIALFTQKFVTKLQNIWGWDTGSGKILFRIPVQGSKGTESQIPDPDPQNWPEVVSVLRALLQLEHLLGLYAELAGAAHQRPLHLLCEAVQIGAQLAQIFVKVGFDEELAMAHLRSSGGN